MKIAILSDIHGNMPALKAVLSELNDVDQIIFLGDLITDFAQDTNEIIKIVRSSSQNVIRGNREGYIINKADNKNDDTWEKHRQFSTSLNTFNALSEDDISYIKSLPQQLSLSCGKNLSLRAVHGSPFSEFDQIRKENSDLITRSLNVIDESILLCGHTHRPFVYSIDGKTLVNAGSVGLNFDKRLSAQYAVIHYNDGDVQIDIKNAKYDYAAFKASCDFGDPWVRLSLKSMEDGENYNMRFLKEAEQRFGLWPISNDDYFMLFNEWCENKII